MIPRAAAVGRSASTGLRPWAPAAEAGSAPRYPGADPDEPTWRYWLFLLVLGVAAPYLLRAAVRRAEDRYSRPSRRLRPPTPVTPAAVPLAMTQPPAEPARVEPASPAASPERTPVAAQHRAG